MRELAHAGSAEGQGAVPPDGSRRIGVSWRFEPSVNFYILRFGYHPAKVAFMAEHVWGDKYPRAEIKQWLEVFLDRFFRISQFKRTAIPNSPKVGSGGSLSPRGDWRAPSDSTGAVWLDELRRNVPG